MTRHNCLPILIALWVVSGCASEPTPPPAPPPPPPPPTPATIEVSGTATTLTAIGDTTRVIATVRDQRGETMATSITWTTSAAAVAAVSSEGVVTAIGNGSATITATAGAVSGTASVTVKQSAVEVDLSPATVHFPSIGATAAVTAVARDSNGAAIEDLPLIWTWESSAADVATVSADGIVTAVGNGTATITATTGSASGMVPVTVEQEAATVDISPRTVHLVSIGATLPLTATVRDAAGAPIEDVAVTWTASAPAIATVSASGVVTAVGSGTATIAARADKAEGTATATVELGGVVEPIHAFLANPAPGNLWEIPVLIIRFLPTKDGLTLDQDLTGFPQTLAEIRQRIDVLDRRVKFMLEEGSRFRGYAVPSAAPSLGYRVVHYLTFYEPLPRGRSHAQCDPLWCEGLEYFPEYHQILRRANAEYWVNVRGVKEIWIWGYHWAGMSQPESNMASPLTGDISNSYRWNDDLPIYEKTYTVYGYNFARLQNEAVHNHGHHLEAILSHADQVQNGNSRLFWQSFAGFENQTFVPGRAGSTHFPPNGRSDYDYHNPTPVLSDIDDWRPDNTGQKTLMSRDRWRDLVYAWPQGALPNVNGHPEAFGQGSTSRTEAQWYMYWMQNMPGRDNTIPHFGGRMTNWWVFTGDWDNAIRAGTGLSTVPNGHPIIIRNDFQSGILLIPGGGLEPGQSLTIHATESTKIGVWDCGEPGASGCISDEYTLTPNKRYRVIQHPSGPVNNLTIVEQ